GGRSPRRSSFEAGRRSRASGRGATKVDSRSLDRLWSLTVGSPRLKKILLADDEPAVRRLVTATLADESRYQILEASDGAEALRLARAERPAMMLLDVNMPEVDGFEVCRALKADPETQGIVVVMLTAMAQVSDRERGVAVGADGFFTKPFSPLALLEKVEEVLGD